MIDVILGNMVDNLACGNPSWWAGYSAWFRVGMSFAGIIGSGAVAVLVQCRWDSGIITIPVWMACMVLSAWLLPIPWAVCIATVLIGILCWYTLFGRSCP